jgi:hypothetical protein
MSDWSTYLGLDIMGYLTFGKRFNCMDSEEHRYIPDLVMRATKFIYVVSSRCENGRLETAKNQSSLGSYHL